MSSTTESARMTRWRWASILFMAAGLVFFGTEFVSAAAWTDPPYSYTFHFISDLGVRGPSTAFGQFMYSPLAWVMNAGFFSFGIIALAGVALLQGVRPPLRVAMLVTAVVLAGGGVLLARFPGSGEAFDDGTVIYHGLGAFAVIGGGNLLAILLGRALLADRTDARPGRRLVLLGTIGLLFLTVFLATTAAGGSILTGLIERAAVYPFLIGLIWAGVALRKDKGGVGRSRGVHDI